MVIWLTTQFRKKTERETEKINTTGRAWPPEKWQDTCMNDSGGCLNRTTDRKMRFVRAKAKTRIGFGNVRTTYETGYWQKLQQRRDSTICAFLELARENGQDHAGIEPTKERRYHTVVETTTNTKRESPSS